MLAAPEGVKEVEALLFNVQAALEAGELRRNDRVDDSSVHSALDPAVEVLSHFNLDETVLSVAVLDDDLVEVSLQEFSAAALTR
ncbi:hypothetical protein ColKHC_09793 [Colletotrichum higginsianum]|nr:hypothetical protein ColKHC_09793 [Colletotrichum higginsianum]